MPLQGHTILQHLDAKNRRKLIVMMRDTPQEHHTNTSNKLI